ncbi:MAG: MFS transporter [Chloroflexi bacterium]|nr:MFS transporter [Chloroflexota bacterium]
MITLTSLAATVQLNPTIGVFVKPITGEFGWSRSTFAGAVTIGTILGGLAALVVGPAIDRFGGRWVLFAGFLLMGGLLVALGSVNALWQFYLIIVSTRTILQGIVMLSNNVLVAKWFVRLRGRAMAFTNVGQRIGNGVMPYSAQAFTTTYSWRTATVAVGLTCWSLTLLPVLFWLRRQPEDMGLVADGRTAPEGQNRQNTPQEHRRRGTERSFTLKEALRTPAFFIILGTVSVSFFVNTGVNFNMLALFTDQGLTATQGATVILAWSFVGIPAVLAAGFLAERLPIRYLLTVVYLGLALGVGVLSQVRSLEMAFLFAAVHGTFLGAMPLLQNLVVADYYGRGSLGVIRGFVTPFQMFGNSLGPLAAAFVFDTTGSYAAILAVFMVLLALAGTSMLAALPPRIPRLAGEPANAVALIPKS